MVVYTDAQADTRQITYVKRSGQDVSFHVALNGNTVTGVRWRTARLWRASPPPRTAP